MPSIAITGHTSGVGRALAELMFTRGWDVIGLSRTTGYDIRQPQPIVEAARDADVFVNNAHHGFAQVELTYQMAGAWSAHPDKRILVMGSVSADGIKPGEGRYAITKQALDGAVEQLQANPAMKCQISTIRFGFTDTPRVARFLVPKMTPQEVAQECLHIITSPLWIKRVDVRVRK